MSFLRLFKKKPTKRRKLLEEEQKKFCEAFEGSLATLHAVFCMQLCFGV